MGQVEIVSDLQIKNQQKNALNKNIKNNINNSLKIKMKN